MADYQATTTEITVHKVNDCPMKYGQTTVRIGGTKDGGYFIILQQEEQEIELDPEELPLIVDASQQLLSEVA